jgi:hypothetical protein
MTKKQNKCSAAPAAEIPAPEPYELNLDASKNGPSLNDFRKIKGTPLSALVSARVGSTVRTVLRTLNQNIGDPWTDQNMDRVAMRAGLLVALPLHAGESLSEAAREAVFKPVLDALDISYTEPKDHHGEAVDHHDDVHHQDNHPELSHKEMLELERELEALEAEAAAAEKGEEYVGDQYSDGGR